MTAAFKVVCKACGQKFLLEHIIFAPDWDNAQRAWVSNYVCRECNKPQEVIDFVKSGGHAVHLKKPWE